MLLAVTQVKQIKLVVESIKVYDVRINELFKTLPDADIFKSLPGIGPCMGPRMLAALGDNRNHFNSAEEIQIMQVLRLLPNEEDRSHGYIGDGNALSL